MCVYSLYHTYMYVFPAYHMICAYNKEVLIFKYMYELKVSMCLKSLEIHYTNTVVYLLQKVVLKKLYLLVEVSNDLQSHIHDIVYVYITSIHVCDNIL